MNKKILITGGTGFFGKSIFMHSLESYNLVLLSRDPERIIKEFPYLSKSVEFIKGDIRNFKYPEGEFDYIYHGTATSSTIIPDEEMKSVILEGTAYMLEFARNRDISNFLFVSSGAVYGNKYFPVRETFSCSPETVYGKSKLEAEKLCIESGIPCSIARCFTFIGEYLPLNAHFAIGNFIRDCLNNQPIIIKGDGTPLRTYLYAKDLVHWLWTILFHGKDKEIYNVGSDDMISIHELANLIREIAKTKNEIQILYPSSTGVLPSCYAPNIDKAKEELGLDITVPLEEAIHRVINYHNRRIYDRS